MPPEFIYEGIDKAGKKIDGKIDAPTDGDARVALRQQGIRPTKLLKANALNMDLGTLFGGGGTVTTENLVTMTRQLHVLITSGIPLVQGLEILADQSPKGTLKNILITVKEKVSGGMFFWESLAAYPKAFPKLYISLIRAGESSGAMDQMLKRLTRYLDDADRLSKMLKAAMMYPIIVVSIGAAVVSCMLIFVIPKFEELLASGGQSLPGPTQFVITLSHFLINNIVAILVGGGVGFYFLKRFMGTESGRAMMDQLAFRLPLFGELAKKGGVARFSRTMSTLLASGVNLLDAIDICIATIDNYVLEDAVKKVKAEVEGGKTLGQVVSRIEVFPRMAVQMITVGETTGNLDKMLERVADFYEQEVETLVGGITKLIEPLVLVFLGGTVGGIMIAMYLPIFKMAGGSE
ncbi:MAG: type II secretion system F family protein [Xanthomonadaceae bacterium]|nr:type II secretion system F family protein [Xanthomonadaceae bacterium]